MKPIRQDTDSSQYNDLLKRIRRLEQQSSSSIVVSAASSVDLGSFDGENTTGVRFTVYGFTTGTGGNTFLRIKPNGLASMPTSAIAQRVYWNSVALTAEVSFGGGLATSPGIVIANTDWATDTNNVSAQGVLYTPSGPVRHYHGIYANEDRQTDGNRHASGRMHSLWNDGVTVVSSLTFSIDAGTFTGRIVTEVI